MANMLAWAERVLKEVDSETGHAVAKVRLVNVEGRTWETWVAPFGKVDEFVAEVNAVLEALQEEMPIKRVQMELVAEDPQGTTHSTFRFTVTGKNKHATAGALGGEGTRAFVEQLEAMTRSHEKLLGMMNNQVRLADDRATAITQAYHDLLDFTRAKAEAEALAAQQNAHASGELQKAIAQNLPQLLEFAALFAPPSMRKVLAGAQMASNMMQHSAPPTNGAPRPATKDQQQHQQHDKE